MPLMYGIAAVAVLANGTDQTGVDPQIDKQCAIVKSEKPVLPTTVSLGTAPNAELPSLAKSSGNKAIAQEGLATTQDGAVTLRATNVSGTINVAEPVELVVAGQRSASPRQTGDRVAGFPLMRYFSDSGLARLKGMDRLVSVQFNNSSAGDVIKWLSKQNVNFVANVDKLPKGKITMNVNQVPLHEALETVAESLGGSWQVRGTTLIFQAGGFPRTMVAPARVGLANSYEFKTFGDMKGLAPMDEMQMLELEKSAKAFSGQLKSNMFNLKEFPKMDTKAFEELKSLHGLGKDGKVFEYKTIDPKAFEELKSLHGLTKDGKAFEFKTVDPKAFEELKSLHGLAKEGKALDLKALSGMRNSLGELNFKGMTFKRVDPEKFSQSMSKAQKDLMKKQGHLKFSDLTEAQKAMLFEGLTKDMPKDFTFMFNVKGEKIIIKN